MTPLRSLGWILLAGVLASSASAQTFDAVSRGWYMQNGQHSAANLNSYAGQGGSGRDRFHAFFVFDLAAQARPAASGVLRLELEGFFGPDPRETFAVHDVSTAIDELLANQTGRTDIFADLGSGAEYGLALANRTDVGSVIEVPLSEAAIAAINLASGGRFAVGVGVETLRLASGSEGIRFSLADETRTHQLVLTEAPMAPPTLELDPAVAAAVPPAEHVLVALAADGTGAALAGATVAFSIVAGPHAGAAASAVTDAGGVAEFAYTGGAAGVDHIVASLAAAGGSAPEAHAMAVWDADCNGNGVPDTCDLACAGFEGACAEFAGCGASLDADADALPDECSANAPPDCSQVSAQPVQLRRPDRHFREVRLGGASDPDGDPVQLRVDAVHQDEPSEIYGFASTCPDARGLGGDRVWLRAERRVRSDGRVYHVDFSADDGRGGSCTGSVTVCVPREGWRHQASCVDQGPRFDSLSCRPRRHPHRGWRPHRDD